jgi:hypothetical protein
VKIFISWSGHTSHKVATTLREWLKSVVQSVVPYVSSEDIDKGARWTTDIAKELEESHYGIICITRENLHAPWINFEAGALSKSIDKANVTPFLFNLPRSEVEGPLLQFQSTVFEQEDIYKLVVSINAKVAEPARLKDEQLKKIFDVWYPQLEKELRAIGHLPAEGHEHPDEKDRTTKMIEELLEMGRQQQRLLNTPEVLLPAGYLEFVLERIQPSWSHDPLKLESLHRHIIELEKPLAQAMAQYPELTILAEGLSQLHHAVHDIDRTVHRRRRFRSRPAPVREPEIRRIREAEHKLP